MKRYGYDVPEETLRKFLIGKDVMGNPALLYEGKVVAFTTDSETPKCLIEQFVQDLCDTHLTGDTPLDFHWVRVDNSDIPTDFYIAGDTYAIPNPNYPELAELYFRWAIQQIDGECYILDTEEGLTGYAVTPAAILFIVNRL